jgi:hypothetical protein
MIKTLCSLALFTLFIGTAHAVLLPPGGTVAPVSADASGLILADTGLLPFAFGSPISTGTVEEIVVADSLNPFGAGDLTFIYQVTNVTGDVGRLTGSSYAGWLTDVSVFTPHPPFIVTGSFSPSTIDRSPGAGDVVGFNFSPKLMADTSLALLIRTNATIFSAGSIGVIDGGGTTLAGFAPAPEPAFEGLLLGGLFAVGLFLTRRFQAKQN